VAGRIHRGPDLLAEALRIHQAPDLLAEAHRIHQAPDRLAAEHRNRRDLPAADRTRPDLPAEAHRSHRALDRLAAEHRNRRDLPAEDHPVADRIRPVLPEVRRSHPAGGPEALHPVPAARLAAGHRNHPALHPEQPCRSVAR